MNNCNSKEVKGWSLSEAIYYIWYGRDTWISGTRVVFEEVSYDLAERQQWLIPQNIYSHVQYLGRMSAAKF